MATRKTSVCWWIATRNRSSPSWPRGWKTPRRGGGGAGIVRQGLPVLAEAAQAGVLLFLAARHRGSGGQGTIPRRTPSTAGLPGRRNHDDRRRRPRRRLSAGRSLAVLPENQRQVILLRYYEGLSCQEVATRLGLPLGTVTKTLSRAYLLLRHELEARDFRESSEPTVNQREQP